MKSLYQCFTQVHFYDSEDYLSVEVNSCGIYCTRRIAILIPSEISYRVVKCYDKNDINLAFNVDLVTMVQEMHVRHPKIHTRRL